MIPNTITVRIHANDRNVLTELFGTESPERGTKATSDGIEATFIGLDRRPGMTMEDILITITINLVTGVPTSLVAAWIYARLAKNGEQGVEIGKDPMIQVTEEEIREAVSKHNNEPPSAK